MSRVVLVTGCSTGIGLATALAFGRRGDRVYATMRAPERGDALRAAVAGEALDVDVLRLDVRDDRSVRDAIGDVLGQEGRLDVVVNNAGVGPFAPIEHSTDDEWLATLDTNLLGPVRVCRAVLPTMRAAGHGVIVTISSVAGRLAAVPTQGAYAASKHAVCTLTDSLNAECGPFGLRAECLEPGFFATSIMDKDTVPVLADDDPYRAVMDGVEGFFRASLAVAPPPDAVATLCVAAADGPLEGGHHHVVGMDGLTPTDTAARGR
ncbi:MAG: SDR family oxidoreductase [Acidimicrobiales bacterium]